jgi:Protein  of unknown function (DUF3018)
MLALGRLTPGCPLIRGIAWNDHAAFLPGQAIFPRLFKHIADVPGQIRLPDFGATPRRRGHAGSERVPGGISGAETISVGNAAGGFAGRPGDFATVINTPVCRAIASVACTVAIVHTVTCNINGNMAMARTGVSGRVEKHRASLRAAGLRPIQIWVPDIRSRSFASKAHRQSSAVAESRQAQEDQEFINVISDRDQT